IDVLNKSYYLGGAGNVAANLKALGGQIFFCSVTGKDNGKNIAIKLLKQAGIQTQNLFSEEQRSTLIKTRITTAEQCLIRIDEGTISNLSLLSERNLILRIESLYNKCDAVLIADYG